MHNIYFCALSILPHEAKQLQNNYKITKITFGVILPLTEHNWLK